MTVSKSKPSTAAKPSHEPKKPGLEIKPIKDMEPDDDQAASVRGGFALPGRAFSDAGLKHCVAQIGSALTKLRGLSF